jgi:hypothetical protein
MDNNAFATMNVLFLTRKLEVQRGQPVAAAFLGKWLPSLLRSLARIPIASDGGSSLAWNSPDDPIVGYGFEDFEVKSGALTYMSLLTLEACALLCNAIRHHAAFLLVPSPRGVAASLCDRANRIADELSTPASVLWDDAVGMFRPASLLEGNLTDVWGSTPHLRFRPPGTVLGAQEIFTAVNPYGTYFLYLGSDNISWGSELRAQARLTLPGLTANDLFWAARIPGPLTCEQPPRPSSGSA